MCGIPVCEWAFGIHVGYYVGVKTAIAVVVDSCGDYFLRLIKKREKRWSAFPKAKSVFKCLDMESKNLVKPIMKILWNQFNTGQLIDESSQLFFIPPSPPKHHTPNMRVMLDMFTLFSHALRIPSAGGVPGVCSAAKLAWEVWEHFPRTNGGKSITSRLREPLSIWRWADSAVPAARGVVRERGRARGEGREGDGNDCFTSGKMCGGVENPLWTPRYTPSQSSSGGAGEERRGHTCTLGLLIQWAALSWAASAIELYWFLFFLLQRSSTRKPPPPPHPI